MHKHVIVFLSVLISFCSVSLVAQTTPSFKVKATLSETDQKKVVAFFKNHDPRETFSYASPLIDTDVVLGGVIALRALALGGLNPEYDFVSIPNSAREREMLKNGDAAVGCGTQWDYWFDQLGDSVYRSSTVIDNGLTEKGLYAMLDKADSIKVKSPKDLATVSVVSSKNWVIDWGTLQKLTVKAVLDAQTRSAMFKMVQAGRAETTLQGFANTPGMAIEDSGIRLVPVKGIKIALNGSRSFMVSKAHPDGKKIFDALEKGLAQMKASKELDRALHESGFLNAAVKDWLLVK